MNKDMVSKHVFMYIELGQNRHRLVLVMSAVILLLQSFIANMEASSWRVEFQAPGSGMRDKVQWFLPERSGTTSSTANTCTLKGH